METLPTQPTGVVLDSPASFSTNEEHVLGQYIPLLYHYNMLQDEDRVGAFGKAIGLTVRPGMHVVELGGGTGILSSFAARRGARVTCVERNPELVATSRRFLADNGLSDVVTVVHADAADFVPEEPVDVVVCEMLHVGLLREKQADVIRCFKRNYFRAMPSSKLPVFVPEVSVLMIQLVEQSFDFAGYTAAVPMFQAPLQEQPRTIELTDLQPYCNLAYAENIPSRFSGNLVVQARQAGYINAVRLITQNILTIDEPNQNAVTWPNQCLVLPVAPRDCEAGATFELSFDYPAGGSIEQLRRSLRLEVVSG